MIPQVERRLTDRLSSLTLRKAVGVIVTVAATLAVSAAVLERLVDPAFDTFGEALWFAVTTVSTVGYGDYVPESAAGRFVAGALMITGLGLIPVITSVVVSILVSQRSREAREQELHHLNLILERMDSLEQKLLELDCLQCRRRSLPAAALVEPDRADDAGAVDGRGGGRPRRRGRVLRRQTAREISCSATT